MSVRANNPRTFGPKSGGRSENVRLPRTRPVPVPVPTTSNPTVDPLPIVPSLPKRHESLTCLQQRLAEIERRQVRDIELIHDYRWKARAARNRILTRQPELERLYEETFGAGWRDELGVVA